MSDFFERIVMLKQTPIFSGVDTENLRVVARELVEEACFVGERVFDINDPSDRMYIIQQGKIGISLHPDPGVKDFIVELAPGECFGEMGVFDDKPRSATAHVLEDAILLSLDKAKLKGLIISFPELSLGVLRSLSLRLREANLRSK
jgi:CRP/FNR family transcriptional regulator, cyclic AMP receptor protein